MRSPFILILFLPLFFGCGYTLRGNSRPLFERHGIRKLYVAPVKNNSYKAGVEITVYNAMRKRISEGGYVTLLDQPGLADAELSATVSEATSSPLAVTTADQIAPLSKGPSTVQIASSYNVNLRVAFTLQSNKAQKTLWMDTISRQKSFVATTYIGSLGSTSALINESDFERTLVDLSNNIVIDAEESMNSIF